MEVMYLELIQTEGSDIVDHMKGKKVELEVEVENEEGSDNSERSIDCESMFDSEFNFENDDELFDTYIDKSVEYIGLQSKDGEEVKRGNVQAN